MTFFATCDILIYFRNDHRYLTFLRYVVGMGLDRQEINMAYEHILKRKGRKMFDAHSKECTHTRESLRKLKKQIISKIQIEIL